MTRATIATELGDIEIDLFDESAPKAAGELHRARQEGLLRRRHLPPRHPGLRHPGRRRAVRQEVVARARAASARGGPGYKFEDEPVQGDYVRGVAGDGQRRPEHERQPVLHLPPGPDRQAAKNYTLFGQVTKGMDVVDKIVGRPAQTADDLPDDPVAMTTR